MSDIVAPHKYRPEPMLMGDCRVCGNVRDAAVHTVEFAAGYREGLEAAAAKLHWLWNCDGTVTERRVADESAAAIRAMKEDTQ